MPAKLHRDTLRMLSMLRRGDLIVSGGGLSIRQLPSGQIEIRIASSDIVNIRDRTPALPNQGSQPGVPTQPTDNPDLPEVPPLPPDPEPSGTYGGGTKKGRKIQGATSDPGDNAPYDFNQRGWQWYLDNF